MLQAQEGAVKYEKGRKIPKDKAEREAKILIWLQVKVRSFKSFPDLRFSLLPMS